MAFRLYPRVSRARKKRTAAKDLSRLPRTTDEVSPRETVRALSGFPGHQSEPESDLSDATGNVSPWHRGQD